MKRGQTRAAAGAAVWGLFLVCALATGQTRIDMYSQAKNIDFSQATSTRPFPVGTTLPAVCAAGETYFKSNAPAGRNVYLCTATNTWTAIESSSTGMSAGGDNVYTGHNDFSSAASLRVRVMTTKPAAADCDAASKVGRVVLRRSDPALDAGILYVCQSTGTGAEWKAASYSYGTTTPQLCDPGELFFNVAAPQGQQWLGCVSANTWRSLSGGGSSAGITTNIGDAGKLLGTNGSAVSWRAMKGFTDDGSALAADGTVLAELDGNNVWSGHQMYPASPVQTLASASATIVCNRHTVAVSAASPVTLNSAATIADGTNGQVCVITNAGAAPITLQDQDRLPASNLQLASPTVVVAPRASVRLVFNAAIGDWIQEGDAQSVQAAKCGAGGTTTAGSTAMQSLAAYTFSAGELEPGDHLRITAFWRHLPGANNTLDSAFRTQLKFGNATLQEVTATAGNVPELFSEYWVYVTGASSQAAVQRHFQTATNSFVTAGAAPAMNASIGAATVSLDARASNAAGSDDLVTLPAYCVEVVKGR
jgi:hypothetical protein